MRGQQDLRTIDGRQGLEDRLDGSGVDSILRFLDQIEPRKVREIGEQGERKQPERSVRHEPGRSLQPTRIAQHQITMPVFLSLLGGNAFEVRQRLANVLDPLLEAVRVFVSERMNDMGKIGSIREIPAQAAWRAG